MRHAEAQPGLIGRVSELAAVVEVLDGAESGVVLLAGPAGIGKTRLVEEHSPPSTHRRASVEPRRRRAVGRSSCCCRP